MKRLFPLLAAALVGACAQQPSLPEAPNQATSALVRVSDGGEFVEIERQPEYSVIELRTAPQGSVPASMFALRGSCAVARARGKKYFASTPVAGAVRAYRLTFPQAATEAQLQGSTKSVFSLEECALLRF